MVNQKDIIQWLSAIGFEHDENIYGKKYSKDCTLRVDVSGNGHIYYKASSPTRKQAILDKYLKWRVRFMVYKLYGQTYDEVLVVDPDTPIKKVEYETAK